MYKVLKHTCLAFELFAINTTPARRATPPWNVYIANCHPGWQGYPTWQTGQPALASYLTYQVNVIKIKWEIIWKDGLPHLGGLPHLPGVPHLHANRPLMMSAEAAQAHISRKSKRVIHVSHPQENKKLMSTVSQFSRKDNLLFKNSKRLIHESHP